jgi:uncharacterized protein (TIGR00730 family)
VFCGSSHGLRSSYLQAATSLATLLVARDIGIVYGGGRVGLMGAVADAALAAGGDVIGVIPQALVDKEVSHRGLADLRIVKSMHERKALMAELSDAFIALPGGFGTLEEFCEVVTWSQLGLHRKACGLLNVDGYFDSLLAFFNHATAEQFIKPVHRGSIVADAVPEILVDRVLSLQLPVVEKWISRPEA